MLKAGKHVFSEKPIAENARDARQLIQWYHSNLDNKRVTWSVAEEKFLYLNRFDHAREQIPRLGPLLGFGVKVYLNSEPGNRYLGADMF